MPRILSLLLSVVLLCTLSACLYSFSTDYRFPLEQCAEVADLDNAILYGINKKGKRIDMFSIEKSSDSKEYTYKNIRDKAAGTVRFIELEDAVYLVQLLEKKKSKEKLITTIIKIDGDKLFFYPGKGYKDVRSKIVAAGFPEERIRHKNPKRDEQAMLVDLASEEDLEQFVDALKSIAADIPFSEEIEGEKVYMTIEQQ